MWTVEACSKGVEDAGKRSGVMKEREKWRGEGEGERRVKWREGKET